MFLIIYTGPIGELPSDARTLLHTPRHTSLREVHPGQYWHNGIRKELEKFLKLNKEYSFNANKLGITFNIDGLPLSKSSNNQVWPILGSIIKTNYVFVIGIYHGMNKKPNCVHEFLMDFICETKQLIENGLEYCEKHYSVSFDAFCADTPAKAFVLNVKYHSGYSSCTKCEVIGEYNERRICFPDFVGVKRTNQGFLNHSDANYHQGSSPLENILGLVSQVPLDYQHLLCLGITKKFLILWQTGSLRVRLPFRKLKMIAHTLENEVKNGTPMEFQRKPRSILYYRQWKATEFRMLLFYSGPVALKDILSPEVYNNFLTIHVAASILSSSYLSSISSYIDYAQELIEHFVKTFKIIYGAHNVSHNVHSLLHITEDVKQFGPLDIFSTFKFENYMTQIKKLIRQSNYPLSQIARRLVEVNNVFINKDLENLAIHESLLEFKTQHEDGPLIANCCNPQYKLVVFKQFKIIAGDLKNNYCSVKSSEHDIDIIRVHNIAFNKSINAYVIIGRYFTVKQDLYLVPCLSSLLEIFKVGGLSNELVMWPLNNIYKKYFVFAIPGKDDNNWSAAIPLLHIEQNERPAL